MRVRKNRTTETVSITGIDQLTLTFLVQHAKESLKRAKTDSIAIQSLNGDLLRICVELEKFLESGERDKEVVEV